MHENRIDEITQRYLDTLAEQARILLQRRDPSVPEHVARETARAAALESPQFARLSDASATDPSAQWEIVIERELPVSGERAHIATMRSHCALSQRQRDEEALHWMAIAGFLQSPLVRASMYSAGYRMAVRVATKEARQ